MRTTVSLDEDILVAVRERARRERSTAGKVLSDLAREALTRSRGQTGERPPQHHGFAPLPHRGEAVSNVLIDQLREEDPA